MENYGYPLQFVAAIKMILRHLSTKQLASLALYCSWPDSWPNRDPKQESFWDENLGILFKHETNPAVGFPSFRCPQREEALVMAEVANELVIGTLEPHSPEGESQAPEPPVSSPQKETESGSALATPQ